MKGKRTPSGLPSLAAPRAKSSLIPNSAKFISHFAPYFVGISGYFFRGPIWKMAPHYFLPVCGRVHVLIHRIIMRVRHFGFKAGLANRLVIKPARSLHLFINPDRSYLVSVFVIDICFFSGVHLFFHVFCILCESSLKSSVFHYSHQFPHYRYHC
jgi:hypothetical protein